MSRGLDNRNPGNIRRSQVKYKGELPQSRDAQFKCFLSMEWGYRAMFVLLHTYSERGYAYTLRQMITRYAPPSENNTDAYIARVAAATGIDPDERLDTRSAADMIPVACAMSQVENGVQADRKCVERGWTLFCDDFCTP